MWANKPDLARRWTDEYGSKPAKKGEAMPKGKAPQPLKGPIKKGTGKAMIVAAGGGRKALRTWRSLSQDVRKTYKSNVAAGTSKHPNVLEMLQTARNMRMNAGTNAVTGNPTPKKRVIIAQTKILTKRRVAAEKSAAKEKAASTTGGSSSTTRKPAVASRAYRTGPR